MDQEMNFPNPVERTDLPTRRRRWPKVLLIGMVFTALIVGFLPQILGTKVGRKFVVSYIVAKTKSPGVTLESFKTSWRGPTELRFLNIPDALGRRIGFKSLTCKASLLDLLRGRFKLGDAVVEDVTVDWVLDDGRGNDTWDRFKGAPGEALPQVSGKVTLNGGTVNLYRGTIQKGVYNTTWSKSTLQNIDATFEIGALDRPWTYTFVADTVEEGVEQRGTLNSKGTVALSPGGGPPSTLDVTFSGEKVRPATLGAALIPGATTDDVREALGAVLDKLDVAVKADAGRFTFERFELSGAASRVRIKPTVDQAAGVFSLAEPGEISLGNCKRLGQGVLVYLNPFLRELAGGTAPGRITLNVEQFNVPLTKQWAKTMTAKGRIKAEGAVLERRDEIGAANPTPDNLASQLALLTGDAGEQSKLDADGAFAVAEGNVSVSGMVTTIGDTTLRLDGTVELDGGVIKESAAIATSPTITSLFQGQAASPEIIPIGGTVLKPELRVLTMTPALPEAVSARVKDRVKEQVARMRSKEMERLMNKSQREVENILRPLKEPIKEK
jgi:hypothetical protein